MSVVATDRDGTDARIGRRRRPGVLAGGAVLLTGLVLTVILASVAWDAADRANNRLLQLQVRGATSAVQSSVASIQAPLLAADRVADSLGSVTAFRSFVATEVGRKPAPFRSISLWDLSGEHPRLVVQLGPRSRVLGDPRRASTLMSSVRPSDELQVVGMLTEPVRVLGFAEMLPNEKRRLAVFAEDAPTASLVHFGASSPFHGLDFALYLGAAVSPSSLIESTVATPVRGQQETVSMEFGNASITVVSALSGVQPASPFAGLPLDILLVGSASSVLASIGVLWLASRRALAVTTALDSRRQYVAERDLSLALQDALLPDERPYFPGVEIATTYRAGTAGLEIGGDWHDAIAIDANRLLIAVGDVSGSGLPAAAVMSSLRHAIRAYAKQTDDPADILADLGRLVSIARDRCFATVLLMVLDVPAHRVTVASAGHLPPVLVEQGAARVLSIPVSPPIGIHEGDPPRSVSFDVAEGAVLLAYTDGLVERRGESIDDGLERLRRAARTSITSVDALIDKVMRDVAPAAADDDAALLGVGWLDRGAAQSWSRRFPATAESVRECREFVTEATAGAPSDVTEVTVLLTSEIASNSVQHSMTEYRVRVDTDGPTAVMRVEVIDWGTERPRLRSPTTSEYGGRGLQLVSSLAARWGVDDTPDPTSSTVWFELD
jgi:hypothetical protein